MTRGGTISWARRTCLWPRPAWMPLPQKASPCTTTTRSPRARHRAPRCSRGTIRSASACSTSAFSRARAGDFRWPIRLCPRCSKRGATTQPWWASGTLATSPRTCGRQTAASTLGWGSRAAASKTTSPTITAATTTSTATPRPSVAPTAPTLLSSSAGSRWPCCATTRPSTRPSRSFSTWRLMPSTTYSRCRRTSCPRQLTSSSRRT
mmetsp:Transcript_65267/g.180973  ORF Transcript_65267/g.180973 Transcript_65267/m.180973 type:complete len:207 (+) Transcript_65267:181-801(+)